MSNTTLLQSILDNMYIVALNFPEKPNYSEKRAVREYFNAIPFLIPCPEQRNLIDTIIFEAMPVEPHVSNRTTLVAWALQVINKIKENTS